MKQDFCIILRHELVYYKHVVSLFIVISCRDIKGNYRYCKGGETKTFEEIGRKIDITREKIRQIESKTMKNGAILQE